jgi:hypothetical protein
MDDMESVRSLLVADSGCAVVHMPKLFLPTCGAQVRFMVRRPMIVDDSGNDDLDDDDLDLAEGAAAGQATTAAAATDGGGGGGGQGDEASPEKEKKKSVRLAADGELAVRASTAGLSSAQWVHYCAGSAPALVQGQTAQPVSTATCAVFAALQMLMQKMMNRASPQPRQSKAAESSRTRCLP